MARKPKLAVWKFASCDGCQLSLFSCEDELLAWRTRSRLHILPKLPVSPLKVLTIFHWSKDPSPRRMMLSEFSEIRARIPLSRHHWGLRNSRRHSSPSQFQDVKEFISIVYARPEYISTLEKSTAIAAHVKVDFELRGCPINKNQLVDVINAFLHGRAPTVSPHSVCLDCKRKGIVCVMVARGVPCMGPVTHTGCGVLCPSYDRGCYGCFGPKENPNTESLADWFSSLGSMRSDIVRPSGISIRTRQLS